MEMFDDRYFMKQALVEAQKAYEAEEVPVGAVVVIDNKIIARAYNLTECLNDVTAHAEMQAITSASHFLNGKYLERLLPLRYTRAMRDVYGGYILVTT
jgi:tRNA(adenine34) deaminase